MKNLNKFQKLTSLLEDNLISAKKTALEEGVKSKNTISIDRNSVVGKHVLTYASIIEVPDNEAEYFPPYRKDERLDKHNEMNTLLFKNLLELKKIGIEKGIELKCSVVSDGAVAMTYSATIEFPIESVTENKNP